MQFKHLEYFIPIMGFALAILLISHFLQSPLGRSSIPSTENVKLSSSPLLQSYFGENEPFRNVLDAFKEWDSKVGCSNFKRKYGSGNKNVSSLQIKDSRQCELLKLSHVNILVKEWTWIPDNLDNLYSCGCGLSCLWTKSRTLSDMPDALLFETARPPAERHAGEPLRVYMDLEAGRRRSGFEDIFVSYHAEDDVQSTYAGACFHNNRNYHVSPWRSNDALVYWSSSRCIAQRNELARKLLLLLPHHSFGKCLNNVGGLDMGLVLYPECASHTNTAPNWWDHLHCVMSHYKFVLAIENTMTESYVTEKLFYALDAGSVPIYFGAPNVWDFVPPHSIIDGSKFESLNDLAKHVKAVANNPVAYAEYHAWRRCGVLGNYAQARAMSLDTLPCRLCEFISKTGGRERTL